MRESEKYEAKDDDICSLCGVIRKDHPRCGRCSIFIGEGHIEGVLVDGICSDCSKRVKILEKKEVK